MNLLGLFPKETQILKILFIPEDMPNDNQQNNTIGKS